MSEKNDKKPPQKHNKRITKDAEKLSKALKMNLLRRKKPAVKTD